MESPSPICLIYRRESNMIAPKTTTPKEEGIRETAELLGPGAGAGGISQHVDL